MPTPPKLPYEMEDADYRAIINDLRIMHSQFTHSDDSRRMKEAANIIESLLLQKNALQRINEDFRKLLARDGHADHG